MIDCVAVALDTDSRTEFEEWCALFGPRVGVLKVGLEAFVRWGPEAVRVARRSARRLFLDLKLHDIPNTVAGAARSARSLGADYLTVHAGGGARMLEAAVEGAGEDLAVLAVTVLTHLTDAELEGLGISGPGAERVLEWCELARVGGCAGVVCSPLEVATLRKRNARPFQLVTPGVRPASGDGAVRSDQRRVATPQQALEGGSDLLVIGRPLTRAADPLAAIESLTREIGAATSSRRGDR